MALNISGVLWLSGVTYITDPNSYNVGILRIKDWADAHASATTVNSTVPDLHNTSHIQVNHTSISIAAVSSNADTTDDAFTAQITTRIHNIEGDGAASWGVGVAPMSLKTIANYINGITPLNAATATVAATATTAGSFSAPQPTKTTIADYKVTASGVSSTVLISPGGAYVDSAGVYVAADASTRTVTLPTQPTGSNIQYCWITKPPSSGPSGFSSTPHASTNGAVGATPNPPAFPTGEEPLALVIWRGTASGGIVLAADIIDIRYGHGGGVSGGGGTYTPANPLVAIGSSGSTFALDQYLAGVAQSATPFNGIRLDRMTISEKLIAAVYTDATQADQNAYLATGPFKVSLQAGSASGTLLWNPPVGIPLTVQVGTNKKRLDSTMSAASRTTNNITAFGAGIYMMVADLTATGPGWVPLLYGAGTVVPQPSTTQMFLGYVVWDGSSFYLSGRNGTPQWAIQNVVNASEFQPLGAFRPVESSENYSSLALAGSPTQLPFSGHTSQLTVQVPNGGMSALVKWSALVTAPGSVQQFYLFPMYYNIIGGTFAEAANVPRFADNTIPAGGAKTLPGWGRIQPINGGPLVVTLGYISSLAGFGIQQIQWDVEVTKQ